MLFSLQKSSVLSRESGGITVFDSSGILDLSHTSKGEIVERSQEVSKRETFDDEKGLSERVDVIVTYDLRLGRTIARWKGIVEEINFGVSFRDFGYHLKSIS
jgi:hypothetical protein